MPNRIKCINRTIEYEGGWVVHDKPTDLGGLTYAGLTKKWTLDRADKPLDAAKQLWLTLDKEGPDSRATQQLARIVYQENYWDKLRCSEFPDYWGVKWSLFDAAVLYGPHTALKWLQDAVGAKPDGWIGVKTLNAARGAVRGSQDAFKVSAAIKKGRIELAQAIVKKKPSQEANLKGWINRAHLVHDESDMRDRSAG